MGQTVREFDAVHLMQPKCGFDSLSGSVLGIGVTGSMPDTATGGVETTTFIQVVETVEDFVRFLNISTAASVQVDFGNGAARASFAETLTFHDFSVYVVAYITVRAGTRQLQNPAFDPTAAQLLLSDKETFRKRFGDEFLAGITEGGEFIGFIELRAHDQTTQQEISTAISGGVVFDTITGDATGSIDGSLSKILATSSINLRTFQRGGSDPGIDHVTVDALVQKAIGFARTLNSSNVFDYEATFQTYDILPLPAAPNPIDVAAQKEALDQLGLFKLKYKKVLDSIQYILDNPSEFEPFDSGALVAKQNEFNNFLNKLKSAASACFNDLTKCEFPTFLIDPVVALPKRLDRDESTAVAAAKDAMTKAQSFALACKAHADRVIAISHTVVAGPNGKSLADEAKLENDNAQQAANSAKDAANTAFDVGSPFASAAAFVAAAKAASDQATSSASAANGLIESIIEIGNAPFWHAPTLILLSRDNLGWMSGTTLWSRPGFTESSFPIPVPRRGVAILSDFAIDPNGDKIEPLPTSVFDNNGQPRTDASGLTTGFFGKIDNWPFVGFVDNQDNVSGIEFVLNSDNHNVPSGGAFLFALRSPSPFDFGSLAGKSFTCIIVLRSFTTGLKTKVQLTLLCSDDPQPNPHIDRNMVIHGSVL